MFKCLDSTGKEIHTDDQVNYLDRPCFVSGILSPTEVQIQPKDSGEAKIVEPDKLILVQSGFISRIKSLASCEELQAILAVAEGQMQEKPAGKKQTVKIKGL